jgi:hypothetical protein
MGDASPGGHEYYCPLCEVKHFPLELYRTWIKQYQGKAKVFLSSGKPSIIKQQVDRWQGILDRHAGKVKGKPKPRVQAESEGMGGKA